MKGKRENARVASSLFSLRGYLLFFLSVSFIVSCCFLLFLGALQDALGMEFEPRHIGFAAKITFGNVMFLSLLVTLMDGVRRKITVERPVERILEATRKLTQGDFSARIQPLHRFERCNEFDVIIEDFNRMAQELSGMETLRADFISNVSHELKTPLAVLQSYAALLQAPGLPEEQRAQYAGAVAAASRRLTELTGNILKLNKLENQRIFPTCSRVEIGEQLCECLLGFEAALEEKGIRLETALEEPVSVWSDAELLTLVWNNLISNAIKFTGPGGTVTVRLEEREGQAVITMADTGCGMTPEVGRHIFEKFYQGDPSHATQGNGLGLALVRRVMDIVGGEISVESRAGQGSAFTVRLQGGTR